MSRPEIFAIPALMLADYFLTVVGAKLSEKNYRQHFKVPNYELNPLFQKQIAQKKWFNPVHLLGVAVVTTLLWILSQYWNLAFPDASFAVLLGFFLTFLSIVIGSHLSNIFTFIYLNRNPSQVSGEVTLNHGFVLNLSAYRFMPAVLPLVIVGFRSRSPFALGAMGAPVALMLVHFVWYFRFRRTESKA